MSIFLLETDTMDTVAESVFDSSQELLELSDTISAYSVDNDTFDFASAKSKIAENMNKMHIKTSNIAQVISFAAEIHTAVQNSIKCQASEGLVIQSSGPVSSAPTPQTPSSSGGTQLSSTPAPSNPQPTPSTEEPTNTQPNNTSEPNSPSNNPSVPGVVLPTTPEPPQEQPTFTNYYQHNYSELPVNSAITVGGASTAMAMVLSAINEKEITPVETTEWGINNNADVPNENGEITYFDNISKAYGIECETIDLTKENILKNISEGKYMIISMDEGKFGNKGNYIVITGITEDGKIKIADPNSVENSEQTWDLSIFLEQGLKLWGFSKPVEKNS